MNTLITQPHKFDPISNHADECECGLTVNAKVHQLPANTPPPAMTAEERAAQLIVTLKGARRSVPWAEIADLIAAAITTAETEARQRALEEAAATIERNFGPNLRREDATAAICRLGAGLEHN